MPAVNTDYLQKSKHQKTSAWLLLCGGAALNLTWYFIYANGVNGETINGIVNIFNPTGPVIALAGFGCIAGSIPLFIAAS